MYSLCISMGGSKVKFILLHMVIVVSEIQHIFQDCDILDETCMGIENIQEICTLFKFQPQNG